MVAIESEIKQGVETSRYDEIQIVEESLGLQESLGEISDEIETVETVHYSAQKSLYFF